MKVSELKAKLNTYGIQPRKEQGQNFLIDDSAIEASINAAEISGKETVLEIGPGFGALTRRILQELDPSTGKLIAIEQDRVLAHDLEALKKKHSHFTLVNEDIREAHLAKHGLEDLNYIMVANLPYSISSWVFRTFLEQAPRPIRMVVMVQKEVADRVRAQAGEMSMLSVAVQTYAEVEYVRTVAKGSFYPAPKIDSAIIRLDRHTEAPSADPEALLKLAKIGFAAKRKQLQKNLRSGLRITAEEAESAIDMAGLEAKCRPQELSVQDWERLRIAIATNAAK